MSLIRKIAAGRMAKRLRGAADQSEQSLEEVQSQLVELGPDAIRSVLQSLRSPDSRQASIGVLRRLVNDRTLPVFMEALASPDHSIADGAATALSEATDYDPGPLLKLFHAPGVSRARLESILTAQGAKV